MYVRRYSPRIWEDCEKIGPSIRRSRAGIVTRLNRAFLSHSRISEFPDASNLIHVRLLVFFFTGTTSFSTFVYGCMITLAYVDSSRAGLLIAGFPIVTQRHQTYEWDIRCDPLSLTVQNAICTISCLQTTYLEPYLCFEEEIYKGVNNACTGVFLVACLSSLHALRCMLLVYHRKRSGNEQKT